MTHAIPAVNGRQRTSPGCTRARHDVDVNCSRELIKS